MSVLKKIFTGILIFILLACNTGFTYIQLSGSREYQLKAIFLFNFTQFIEWPPSTFPEPETPFTIGILGNDPFGNYLIDAVSGEQVNGHTLVIEHYNSIEEIKKCHILFINMAQTDKLLKVLASLKAQNTLTISDTASFLKNGGMISFFTKNNKIQFSINPEATKKADLTVSSKLLRLAEIYVDNKK